MVDTRLHIVTGKGGTGKTTVAGALALAIASGGSRVLLVEVEGRQGISQTFDVPPLGDDEVCIAHTTGGGQIHALAIDAKAALLEYLQLFYKMGKVGGILERFGAIDFATTIAPGLRDVLQIGKIYEATRRRENGRHKEPGEFAYDAIVLDAPPTGRVVRFLNANAEIADLAKVGPIRSQADSITTMLASPMTRVHLVTLLEEMPVQECIDTIGELAQVGMHAGSVIINEVRESLLQGSLPSTEAVRRSLAAVGAAHDEATIVGLVREGRDHLARIAVEAEQSSLLEATGLPLMRLPSLEGVDADALGLLAEELLAQGMAV